MSMSSLTSIWLSVQCTGCLDGHNLMRCLLGMQVVMGCPSRAIASCDVSALKHEAFDHLQTCSSMLNWQIKCIRTSQHLDILSLPCENSCL